MSSVEEAKRLVKPRLRGTVQVAVLEAVAVAFEGDRVQRGAEQPGAWVGVRFPYVQDQLAYGSPAEHFVRFFRLEAGARFVQRESGGS